MRKALFVFLLCCGTFVFAQTPEFPSTSGNAFLRLCSAVEKDKNTQEEAEHSLSCLGYVEGFTDGVRCQAAFAKVKMKQEVPKLFCRPEGVELGQLVSIVLKYVRNHPEDAHQPTGLLIMAALRGAYPCPSE